MANNIERLNYYEREHLRSFDFVAEQNYHLEMRRRLNLALHLWGIVDGLDVRKGNLVPGAPDQFYITEGMAIDAYGREIVLFAPYALSEDDLRINRVDRANRYSLWIAYDRNQATPPSPGYGICDVKDQYTRWHESFKIVIKEESYANAAAEPEVFSPLSDDPVKESWLVRLGTIDTAVIDSQLNIDDAWPDQRTYIGVRTQRVVAPVASLLSTDPAVPSPPDAARPISVEADLLEEKNLIVGVDFPVDGNTVTPKPADPANFPGPSGNIKATNLFLQGNLYSKVGPNWLALREYVQTIIPDIQIGTKDLAITPAADPSTGVEMIRVTSVLSAVKNPKLIASISKIQRLSFNQYINWITLADASVPIRLEVTVEVPIQIASNIYDFPVRWTIGPTGDPNTAAAILNVTGLTISYVAILYPL